MSEFWENPEKMKEIDKFRDKLFSKQLIRVLKNDDCDIQETIKEILKEDDNMDKKICKNCAFWQHFKDGYPYGHCAVNVPRLEGCSLSRDVTDCDYDKPCYSIEFGENFGCIHWEKNVRGKETEVNNA